MGTPLLGAGTTLHLGVHEPGGLLAVGDGHARRGGAEAYGGTHARLRRA
jgi:amidase